MTRWVEGLACLFSVLLMSIGAAKTPESSARYEEILLYDFCAGALVLLATTMYLFNRQPMIRPLLYPAALLLSCAMLLIGIHNAYGYSWGVFWTRIPHGVGIALHAAVHLFALNNVIPFLWPKITAEYRNTESIVCPIRK